MPLLSSKHPINSYVSLLICQTGGRFSFGPAGSNARFRRLPSGVRSASDCTRIHDNPSANHRRLRLTTPAAAVFESSGGISLASQRVECGLADAEAPHQACLLLIAEVRHLEFICLDSSSRNVANLLTTMRTQSFKLRIIVKANRFVATILKLFR